MAMARNIRRQRELKCHMVDWRIGGASVVVAGRIRMFPICREPRKVGGHGSS